jgi:hypothetical protein
MAFRLAWFKRNFPRVKVVHIYRRREEQWQSLLARVQAFVGKEDVGQDSVEFAGFNIRAWCDDLSPHFPQLEASRSANGAERFAKLWEISYESNRAAADVSIGYHELLTDFERSWMRIANAVEMPPTDVELLKQCVVTPEKRGTLLAGGYGEAGRVAALADVLRRKYARLRVRMQDRRRESQRTEGDRHI